MVQRTAPAGPEPNLEIFNSVADSYVRLSLDPAERRLLRRLASELNSIDMLELGVGTGRVGYTFAPLVRRYVGVDYAPAMVERARLLLCEDPNVELVLGDARDLSCVSGQFGLILFSFNGIDAVSFDDRRRILAGVFSVLRPGGWFMFSSHSIGALPLPTRRDRSARRFSNPLLRFIARLDDVVYGFRVRRVNRRTSIEDARRQGWVIVRGIGHRFTIDDCYVDPAHQIRVLLDGGFEVVEVLDVRGRPVSVPHLRTDPWLHYVCRKPSVEQSGHRTSG